MGVGVKTVIRLILCFEFADTAVFVLFCVFLTDVQIQIQIKNQNYVHHLIKARINLIIRIKLEVKSDSNSELGSLLDSESELNLFLNTRMRICS